MAVMIRVAALVVGLGLVVLPPAASDARPAPTHGMSWSGLGVWHFTSRGISFGGNELRYPPEGVAAITSTADAAIVQLNGRELYELGPVIELPATGEAGRPLEKHPLGTVIADPNGHVAFWSSKRPDGAHLVALDTSTGVKVVGPAVKGRQRVFAVEGSTAYVVDGFWKPDPLVSSWTLGQPALTPLLPAFSHGGIVSDVSGDRVLSFDFDDGLYLTDRAGTLLRTLPLLFGTFSPDAAHVVGYRGERIALYETETAARVRFSGLHGRSASTARWSPGGVLVVDTVAGRGQQRSRDWVITFACSAADGRCQRLRGRAFRGVVPVFPSDAFGQFLDFLPSDS